MNKKGILDKIITSFPVLLGVILVLTVYLVLSGIAFVIKGVNVPSSIEQDSGLNEGILFNEITIDGERMSIVHGLIKEASYKNEEHDIRNKIGNEQNAEEAEELRVKLKKIGDYTGKVDVEIEKEIERENLKNDDGEEKCFILKKEPVGILSTKVIALKAANGKAATLEKEIIDAGRVFEEAGLLSSLKLSIYSNLLSKELDFSIKSYYGKCYGIKALESLKVGI